MRTIATTLLADAPAAPAAPYRHGLSLLHGWLPGVDRGGRRHRAAVRRWAGGRAGGAWYGCRWPLLVGVAAAGWTHWYVDSEGMSDDPAPRALWIWVGLTGFAVAVVALGWSGAQLVAPRRVVPRGAAVRAQRRPGAEPVGRLLPDRANRLEPAHGGAAARRDRPADRHRDAAAAHHARRTAPSCPSTIPSDASHFKHRTELVYLPPAWFAEQPATEAAGGHDDRRASSTPLPTGCAPATRPSRSTTSRPPTAATPRCSCSSIRAARSTTTPNASTARAATPPTISPKMLCRIMISQFGVSPSSANWGIVGWSMGGTCAVDLTVMHPGAVQFFRRHRRRPGTDHGHQGTDHCAAVTAATRTHGPRSTRPPSSTARPVHRDLGVVRDIQHPPGPAAQRQRRQQRGRPRRARRGGQPWRPDRSCQFAVCPRQANGITCAVVATPGKHDWPFAADDVRVVAALVGRSAGHAGWCCRPRPPRSTLPGTPNPSQLVTSADQVENYL